MSVSKLFGSRLSSRLTSNDLLSIFDFNKFVTLSSSFRLLDRASSRIFAFASFNCLSIAFFRCRSCAFLTAFRLFSFDAVSFRIIPFGFSVLGDRKLTHRPCVNEGRVGKSVGRIASSLLRRSSSSCASFSFFCAAVLTVAYK